MSAHEFDHGETEDPICEYCGGYITEPYQKCPALEEGCCYP